MGRMDGASSMVLHVVSTSVGQVGYVVVMVGNGPCHHYDPYMVGVSEMGE